MRNRKYLIGALVGVIGALALSGVANAAVTGQTLSTTLSPAKQSAKTFGGVSLHNIISTTIDNPATTQSPKTTVFTLDPNVKYVSGNIPAKRLLDESARLEASHGRRQVGWEQFGVCALIGVALDRRTWLDTAVDAVDR